MIISHEHRFVFLHNPKAAGSAIRISLADLHDDPTEFWHQGYLPRLNRVVDLAHLTHHDLELQLDSSLRGYEFLTVVRDPYARFLSAVSEHQRQHGLESMDLDEWIVSYMDETNFRFNWKYVHLCPQHYFVPTHYDGVHVLRHEYLSREWKAFLEASLNKEALKKVKPMPNTRVRPDASKICLDTLTPFAIAEINRVYYMDFKRFGYPMRATASSITSLSRPATHYDRVNAIHSPFFCDVDPECLSPGEKIAYLEKRS